MKIHQAINRVLGERAATAIINDLGLHWAALAAMSACQIRHGPEVVATIRNYFDDLREKQAMIDQDTRV